MGQVFLRIQELAAREQILISEHGYDELSADGILIADVYDGVAAGALVEEYPEYHKGPCVLILQRDHDGEPVHVLWGVPRGMESPAVVVTAYRPDPARWSSDFLGRRS